MKQEIRNRLTTLAVLGMTQKNAKPSIGIRIRDLRSLMLCRLIVDSGRHINFTNLSQAYQRFYPVNDYQYRTTTFLKALVELGYIKHHGKPKHSQDRQNYIITAAGIIKLDEIDRMTERQVNKYKTYGGYQ